MREAVGVDFKAPELDHPKLRTLATTLEDRLPFGDASFEVVTLLAVLEHRSHPLRNSRQIVSEMCGT